MSAAVMELCRSGVSSQGLPGRLSKACKLSGQKNWDVVLCSTCNAKHVAKHILLMLI